MRLLNWFKVQPNARSPLSYLYAYLALNARALSTCLPPLARWPRDGIGRLDCMIDEKSENFSLSPAGARPAQAQLAQPAQSSQRAR